MKDADCDAIDGATARPPCAPAPGRGELSASQRADVAGMIGVSVPRPRGAVLAAEDADERAV